MKLFFYILSSNMILYGDSVAERYGDRIELLGVTFKDPLVLCQILIAIFFFPFLVLFVKKEIVIITRSGDSLTIG